MSTEPAELALEITVLALRAAEPVPKTKAQTLTPAAFSSRNNGTIQERGTRSLELRSAAITENQLYH